MTRRRTPDGILETHVGADYSDDERAFLKAMDRYKRENRRPFPTWREVLDVLKGLGYRKAPTDAERTEVIRARDRAEEIQEADMPHVRCDPPQSPRPKM